MGSVGALVIRSHGTREIWGEGKGKNLMVLRTGWKQPKSPQTVTKKKSSILKNEGNSDTCDKMDEPLGHDTQWKAAKDTSCVTRLL